MVLFYMKILLLIYVLSYVIFAQNISQFIVKKTEDNSFITKYEYGKMLYNNPRGISCAKCHAEDAKGKLISKFIHKKKKKEFNCILQTEDITKIKKEKFFLKLDYFKKKEQKEFNKSQICEKLIYGNTMPKYFLTNKEMDSIYYYITHIGELE